MGSGCVCLWCMCENGIYVCECVCMHMCGLVLYVYGVCVSGICLCVYMWGMGVYDVCVDVYAMNVCECVYLGVWACICMKCVCIWNKTVWCLWMEKCLMYVCVCVCVFMFR